MDFWRLQLVVGPGSSATLAFHFGIERRPGVAFGLMRLSWRRNWLCLTTNRVKRVVVWNAECFS